MVKKKKGLDVNLDLTQDLNSSFNKASSNSPPDSRNLSYAYKRRYLMSQKTNSRPISMVTKFRKSVKVRPPSNIALTSTPISVTPWGISPSFVKSFKSFQKETQSAKRRKVHRPNSTFVRAR
jgi:hypothetical protein